MCIYNKRKNVINKLTNLVINVFSSDKSLITINGKNATISYEY